MVRSIAQAYRDAYGGLSIEIWILSLALLINRCGSMVLAFLTIYLVEQLGFSPFQAGMLFSLHGFGSLVGSYLGGRLVKPLGAVRTQIVGLLLSAPLMMIMPLFTQWWSIGITIFLYSMFSQSVRPANSVAVSQFTPPDLLTRAFGLLRMAGNLGFSIGPVIGGLLVAYGYPWLFIVDGITTGVGGMILIQYFGFRKYSKRDSAAKMQKAAEQTVVAGGSPMRDKSYIAFLALMLLSSLIFFQFFVTYPKYLKDFYALDEFRIGLLFAVNTVIIVVFEMLLLEKVRKFSLLRTLGWGCLLSCIGFAMLPLGSTFWFCVLAMCVVTVGEMFMFPVGSGFVAQRSLGRDRGMYMSGYSMNYSLAAIIAPLFGTAVYELNPHWLWLSGFLIGAIVLVGFYALARRVESEKFDAEEDKPVALEQLGSESV